jgi:hypothetical protein
MTAVRELAPGREKDAGRAIASGRWQGTFLSSADSRRLVGQHRRVWNEDLLRRVFGLSLWASRLFVEVWAEGELSKNGQECLGIGERVLGVV